MTNHPPILRSQHSAEELQEIQKQRRRLNALRCRFHTLVNRVVASSDDNEDKRDTKLRVEDMSEKLESMLDQWLGLSTILVDLNVEELVPGFAADVATTEAKSNGAVQFLKLPRR